MRVPKIQIIKGWVYIDGKKAKKKYMPDWYHCRDIFYDDEYVVKVENKDGEYFSNQNGQEYSRWKNVIEKSDKKYFAPCLKYCEAYLIQKRIPNRTFKRTDSVRELVWSLSKKYDLCDVEGDENKNWLMADSRTPCIFDYGS